MNIVFGEVTDDLKFFFLGQYIPFSDEYHVFRICEFGVKDRKLVIIVTILEMTSVKL